MLAAIAAAAMARRGGSLLGAVSARAAGAAEAEGLAVETELAEGHRAVHNAAHKTVLRAAVGVVGVLMVAAEWAATKQQKQQQQRRRRQWRRRRWW